MRDHNRPVLHHPFSSFRLHPLFTFHFPLSTFTLLLLAATLSSSCSKPENQWQVGGLYSISNAEGQYVIAKVLAIDPGVVSVRIYKQTFPDRPRQIDPSTLSLGSLSEGPEFGIGHLPLKPEAFKERAPVFIMKVEVHDDELEGYRTWRKSIAGPADEPPVDEPSEDDQAGQDELVPPPVPESAPPGGGPPNG
jgi:hypothetical protein